MADKTTTLKTKTNDNVYPNIIGDNRDNAISDSPQIKHTLTAEHKISLRLDNNVNNLINNSLQKPAGLTKTKLVGVGTNGQENIEIGDNLTLSNGKLSASGGVGGKIYLHSISINSSELYIYINIYSNSNTQLTYRTFENLVSHYGKVICTGFYKTPTMYGIPNYIEYDLLYGGLKLYYFDTTDKRQKNTASISRGSLQDSVVEIL